jgi:predicted TPR repeat methyltransferase
VHHIDSGRKRSATELFPLAENYTAQGKLQKAEKTYRKIIGLQPDLAEAHNNLGDILLKSNRLLEAKLHFSRAIALKPSIGAFHNNLANALSAEGQHHEAIAAYRKALSFHPLADAHNGLGSALGHVGEIGEAQTHFSKALEIDPFYFAARMNLGLSLAGQGNIAQALEHTVILTHATSAPGFPVKSFGILLARVGCPEGAKECFEQYLAKNPSDKDGVALLLAAVGGALPDRVSDQQIGQIYSNRAEHWDHGTVGPTGYQGHKLVALAMQALTSQATALDIVDAGCGTGLVGVLLREKARRLVGIDLSAPMLDKAREKKTYDELHRRDLVDYLANNPESCDVITSAATLIHFGDLGPVLDAAARCLRVRGLFIFTLFPNDDPDGVAAGTLDGFAQGGCFRHGRNYVAKAAEQYGFQVESIHAEAHEYVRKQPVTGLVVALRLAHRANQPSGRHHSGGLAA